MSRDEPSSSITQYWGVKWTVEWETGIDERFTVEAG